MRVAPTLRRDFWLAYGVLAALATFGAVTAEQPVGWSLLMGLGGASLLTPLVFGLSFAKRTARRWGWGVHVVPLSIKVLVLLVALVGQTIASPRALVAIQWVCYVGLVVVVCYGSLIVLLAVRGWQRYGRVRQRLTQQQ